MVQALAFGDLHGQIRAMYTRAREWESEYGRSVELVLQVGDFGVFPNPSALTEEKIGKYGVGDYEALVEEGWSAPIPTYFCKGNNEDFQALENRLVPGLTYVPDGEVITLGESRVAFLGGIWAPKSYAFELPKPNHISRAAVENLISREFDVLVCHDAPAGTRYPNRVYAVGAPPIRDLIEAKQPRLVLHGHHHLPGERTMGGSRVVSLGLFLPNAPDSAVFALEL
jgi:Icc-related predicted phosphoesterase